MPLQRKNSSRLTLYILAGLLLGIALGFWLNGSYVQEENRIIHASQDYLIKDRISLKSIADTNSPIYKIIRKDIVLQSEMKKNATALLDKKLEPFSLLGDLFLRLIKMIIAPLVFSTLVVGVAKLGDIKSVGRIGAKTLVWFVSASITSLFLGMLLVNILKPGEAMHLVLPFDNDVGLSKGGFTVRDFLYHVFPTSVIDAMARNEILQIVVFAILFGMATAALGEKGKMITQFFDSVSDIILKMTGYIMKLAPIAVFGAICAVIARQGPGILQTYFVFIIEFYAGLFILWVILFLAGALFAGKDILRLIHHIREPILLAFSTSSSEAAFPKTLLELERFGCEPRIVSFVLPLGYSFNLDGSMMYMTFASLFIAQSYGIHLDFASQVSMLFVLMLTSKGVAGVPRASLVVVAATLATFNLPEAGLALLLGIDPLLDMGRSATNVVGNSIAAVVVNKTEAGKSRHEN